MLVDNYIYEAYQGFIQGVTKSQQEVLDAELAGLLTWGERHAHDVNDPGKEERQVRRVHIVDGKPAEVYVARRVWPLEASNKDLLPGLDQRIVDGYKALKTVGFERPSIVLSVAYFRHIHLYGDDAKYKRNFKAWAGAMLVSQRLESTCRIAVRYEFPERFGPKVVEKNGSTFIEYTKDAWKPALIHRGVIPRKKGEANGSRGSKDNGRKMRQVSKSSDNKESGGPKGKGNGARDVKRAVSRKQRKQQFDKLQQDLPTLPKPSHDSG